MFISSKKKKNKACNYCYKLQRRFGKLKTIHQNLLIYWQDVLLQAIFMLMLIVTETEKKTTSPSIIWVIFQVR